MKRKLVFKDGTEFIGDSFGSINTKVTEIVFNTSMVGYQEIISDNSYSNQGVVMTYPLIGNYGINETDSESVEPALDSLIVKEICKEPSHYQSNITVDQYCLRFDICGISNVDTRAITKIIRETGSQLAVICDLDLSYDAVQKLFENYVEPNDQVSKVSTQKPYRFENKGPKIVAIDCGIKLNIVRELHNLGFDVTILPYNSTLEDVLSFNPDGLFLSNGPGDPRNCTEVIDLVKNIQGILPIFGICLGHQIIGLANNCTIEKMKFGHRGGNHPVKNLRTGKVEITSQNHSFAISDIDKQKVEVTHINLLDNTIEGLKHKKYPVFSVQYHPESAPGPMDSIYLFKQFKDLIQGDNNA